MSARTIQPGDVARVATLGPDVTLLIDRLDQQGIHAGRCLIAPQNGRWKIVGYNNPHAISFIAGTSPEAYTGIPEVDIPILAAQAEPFKLIRDNKYLNSLHNDDRFWKLKVEHDFGPDVAQLKPPQERFSHQHSRLNVITYRQDLVDEADEAAKEGQLDMLTALAKRGVYPTIGAANFLAMQGRIDLLDWLADKGIYPTLGNLDRGAWGAADRGRWDVVKWIFERTDIPKVELANMAAWRGNLEMLNWLLERGVLPDLEGANLAARAGKIDVLRFLERHDILPDVNGANLAAQVGHTQVLEFLQQHGIQPTIDPRLL